MPSNFSAPGLSDRKTALVLHPATTAWARLRGLHARPGLTGDTGLWLSPCKAVHTFGLAYGIDVVFLGADYRVVKTIHRLGANQVVFSLAARSVVELPAGYCHRYPDYGARIRWALIELV